eukprot:gene15458-28169_t
MVYADPPLCRLSVGWGGRRMGGEKDRCASRAPRSDVD